MTYSPRRRLEDSTIAALARVCQLYGIPATLGRLYALLYLSPGPLSLAELAAATGAAKSTTSVALRRLERYRFVRRRPRGSDRRDYYEAVTDPMTIIRDWLRHFIGPELAIGDEMIAELERDLGAAELAGEYTPEESAQMEQRVAELRRAMAMGRGWMTQLLTPEDEEP